MGARELCDMLMSNADERGITRALEGAAPSTFVQRIQNAFFGRAEPKTTLIGLSTALPGIGDQRSKLWTIRRAREAILADAKQMQDTDPRWASILDAIARDATIGGFDLSFHSGGKFRRTRGVPRAQQVLQQFIKLAGIDDKLEGWAKALVRDGDLFTELVVDKKTGKPTNAKKLDARITVPAKNKRGGWLHGPHEAYYQTDGITDTAKTWFAEWQIVHVKWGGDEGDIFGTSQLMAGRKAWQMLIKLEEDLVLRRRLRAGLKFLHSIDGTPNDLARYREQNKQVLENPFAVQSDIFINRQATVTELVGDTAVDRIEDVIHLLHTLFVRGQFPKALLGYEQSINRDVLREQMKQYTKFLRTASWRMSIVLREIFRRVLLLNGIDDEGVEYEIRWRWRSDDELKETTDMAIKLLATGRLSSETFYRLLNVPGLTWEGEAARIKEEMAEFPHLQWTLQQVPVLLDNPLGITGQLKAKKVPGGEPERVRIPKKLAATGNEALDALESDEERIEWCVEHAMDADEVGEAARLWLRHSV